MHKYTVPHIHREYPKWVTLPDGSSLIVHNKEEERILSPVLPDEPAPLPDESEMAPKRTRNAKK